MGAWESRLYFNCNHRYNRWTGTAASISLTSVTCFVTFSKRLRLYQNIAFFKGQECMLDVHHNFDNVTKVYYVVIRAEEPKNSLNRPVECRKLGGVLKSIRRAAVNRL